MKVSTRLNFYFAHFLWNLFPLPFQKTISYFWTIIYKTPASKILIKPFVARYSIQKQLPRYVSASGLTKYKSFQDFFTRKLAQPLKPVGESIFPCEGFICESGLVGDLPAIKVKGQSFTPRNIFGSIGEEIPDSYLFINIFLHNHNYHRFHSPITGVIKSIQRIPGHLNFLRPWLYPREQVSEPACVNERIVLEIEQEAGQSWFMSFVGGMGVGIIQIHDQIQIGNTIQCGDEIGLFLLGSTCCVAIPRLAKTYKYLTKVSAGDPL